MLQVCLGDSDAQEAVHTVSLRLPPCPCGRRALSERAQMSQYNVVQGDRARRIMCYSVVGSAGGS